MSNAGNSKHEAIEAAFETAGNATRRVGALLLAIDQRLMDVMDDHEGEALANDIDTILQLNNVVTEYHEKILASLDTLRAHVDCAEATAREVAA